jgi:glycine cleavage system H protein
VSGEIIAVNAVLEDSPETVNADPYGEGWFFRLQPSDISELDQLLDAAAYQRQCEDE